MTRSAIGAIVIASLAYACGGGDDGGSSSGATSASSTSGTAGQGGGAAATTGEGGAATGGGGGLPFGSPCADDTDCESGLCFDYNANGPHCTIPCQDASDCPMPPSTGCNGMGVCKYM